MKTCLRARSLPAAIAAFLAITGVAATAAAESPPNPVDVVVGDGVVDATRLRPYDNAMAVTYDVANGEKISTGIWADQLRLRDVNGRKAWVRTQSMASFNGGVLTSVNTFDPVSFAPISTILKRRDGSSEYWTFSDGRAEVHTVAPDGKTTVKTGRLAPSYDFNCCMASLIPAALPLAIGKSFSLPAAGALDAVPDRFVFHVKGRERIKAGFLGVVDAWVVEGNPPNSGGGTVTFWITDNPRRLVRERLTNFPANKTCAAPDVAEHASCPAQGTVAGLRFNQTFEMLGNR